MLLKWYQAGTCPLEILCLSYCSHGYFVIVVWAIQSALVVCHGLSGEEFSLLSILPSFFFKHVVWASLMLSLCETLSSQAWFVAVGDLLWYFARELDCVVS